MNWRVARVVWYDLKCPRSSVDRVLASGARDRSSNLRGGYLLHRPGSTPAARCCRPPSNYPAPARRRGVA